MTDIIIFTTADKDLFSIEFINQITFKLIFKCIRGPNCFQLSREFIP